MLIRFLSYVMMAFFLVSVIVQFNDPDWPLWILAYGAILIVTVLITFNVDIKVRWVLITLLLFYAFGVFQWSDSFANTSLDAFMAVGMKNAVDEGVRELWGLVICLIWTIVLVILNWRKSRPLDG
ncbi:MAG: transmembrane 220 family protein [Methylococcales bacterium]